MKVKTQKTFSFCGSVPISIRSYLYQLWQSHKIPLIFEWRVGRSGIEPDLLSELLMDEGAVFDEIVIVKVYE